MREHIFTKEMAEAANFCFEQEVHEFLRSWAGNDDDDYLMNDALGDFFLLTQHPLGDLLGNQLIAHHLGRSSEAVYFDPVSGDPLLAYAEQRIYNLARRMDNELMHIPFRSVQPNKQTRAGDVADISTYPAESGGNRYNSGNHFASRPANGNVFDETSRRCTTKSAESLHVFYKRGYLEDRLQEVKAISAAMHESGETQQQFFVVCSRHSPKEGHFGASLVIMDPLSPDFPMRVIVCDTLLKELPQHPRWWNYFVAEYSNVFGEAIIEIMEDLSHPLQKVNIKGDNPYHHDWDCPYYVASMADALADLVKSDPNLALSGSATEIHYAMKGMMQDYYKPNHVIKERPDIKQANRLKRWTSGRQVIKNLQAEINRESSY